jgi:hypothetical protein
MPTTNKGELNFIQKVLEQKQGQAFSNMMSLFLIPQKNMFIALIRIYLNNNNNPNYWLVEWIYYCESVTAFFCSMFCEYGNLGRWQYHVTPKSILAYTVVVGLLHAYLVSHYFLIYYYSRYVNLQKTHKL